MLEPFPFPPKSFQRPLTKKCTKARLSSLRMLTPSIHPNMHKEKMKSKRLRGNKDAPEMNERPPAMHAYNFEEPDKVEKTDEQKTPLCLYTIRLPPLNLSLIPRCSRKFKVLGSEAREDKEGRKSFSKFKSLWLLTLLFFPAPSSLDSVPASLHQSKQQPRQDKVPSDMSCHVHVKIIQIT